MLILILIDIQYSQKAVSSFEKGLNHQNHSSSGSIYPEKNSLPSKISDSLHSTGESLPPSTPYHYLENPASMEPIFCQF